MATHDLKPCGVNIARLLKDVWSFSNVIREKIPLRIVMADKFT